MDKRTATRQGKAAGKAHASWVFDYTTSDDTYKEFIQGFGNGDSEIIDAYDVSPLSGEWAGESIQEILGDRVSDASMDAYDSAFQKAYWNDLIRVAIYHVKTYGYTLRAGVVRTNNQL
jgi:hypothetical protein